MTNELATWLFVDRLWFAGNFEPSEVKTNSSTDSEPANDRCEDSLNSTLELRSSQRILLHNINILIGFVLYILYGTKPITPIELDVPANRKESASLKYNNPPKNVLLSFLGLSECFYQIRKRC